MCRTIAECLHIWNPGCRRSVEAHLGRHLQLLVSRVRSIAEAPLARASGLQSLRSAVGLGAWGVRDDDEAPLGVAI